MNIATILVLIIIGAVLIGTIGIIAGLLLMVWDTMEGTMARWKTSLINTMEGRQG